MAKRLAETTLAWEDEVWPPQTCGQDAPPESAVTVKGTLEEDACYVVIRREKTMQGWMQTSRSKDVSSRVIAFRLHLDEAVDASGAPVPTEEVAQRVSACVACVKDPKIAPQLATPSSLTVWARDTLGGELRAKFEKGSFDPLAKGSEIRAVLEPGSMFVTSVELIRAAELEKITKALPHEDSAFLALMARQAQAAEAADAPIPADATSADVDEEEWSD